MTIVHVAPIVNLALKPPHTLYKGMSIDYSEGGGEGRSETVTCHTVLLNVVGKQYGYQLLCCAVRCCAGLPDVNNYV